MSNLKLEILTQIYNIILDLPFFAVFKPAKAGLVIVVNTVESFFND